MDPIQESFFSGRFPLRYPQQHPPPPEDDIQKRRVIKNLTGYRFEPASSLRPTGLPNRALLEKIDITKNKALLEADKKELPKKAISKPALLYCGTKEESLQEKDRLLGKVQQAKDQYAFEKNKELLDQQIGKELPQPQKRSNPIDPLLNPEEDYMRKRSIAITSKKKQQEIRSSTKLLDPSTSSTTHSSLLNASSKKNELFDIPMPDSSFLISSSELKLEEEKKFKLQDFYKKLTN